MRTFSTHLLFWLVIACIGIVQNATPKQGFFARWQRNTCLGYETCHVCGNQAEQHGHQRRFVWISYQTPENLAAKTSVPVCEQCPLTYSWPLPLPQHRSAVANWRIVQAHFYDGEPLSLKHKKRIQLRIKTARPLFR